MWLVHQYMVRAQSQSIGLQWPVLAVCDAQYIALPMSSTTVSVYLTQDLAHEPLFLNARSQLGCIQISNQHPVLLATVAEQAVIVWDLQQAYQCTLKGDCYDGNVISRSLDLGQCCCFSPDDCYIAISVDTRVFVLSMQADKCIAELSGHLSTITCMQFCPHYSSTLITAGNDRTFKVWNISESCLIFQSSIISSSPFLSLAMHPTSECMALGTADGQIRIFDLRDCGDFTCLHHIDVAKTVSSWQERSEIENNGNGPVRISSTPSSQPTLSSTPETLCSSTELGVAVLSLCYTSCESMDEDSVQTEHQSHDEPDVVINAVLKSSPMLIVGTTGSLMQFNASTLELADSQSWQAAIISLFHPEKPEVVLSVAGSLTLNFSCQKQKVWCVLTALFDNQFHILTCDTVAEGSIIGIDAETDEYQISNMSHGVTVLSSAPLHENSPLRAQLQPKEKTAKTYNKASVLESTKASNKPVTFKNKIKSSGYAVAGNKRTMFQPQTKLTKPVHSQSHKKNSKSVLCQLTKDVSVPWNNGPSCTLKQCISLTERPTPINRIDFNGTGSQIACALGNNTVASVRLSSTQVSNHSTNILTGHNGAVNSVHWSHDGLNLVTASDDKTAMLWVSGQTSEPVITFKNVSDNFNINKEGCTTINKPGLSFGHGIKHAQFYYLDQFIILITQNIIYLYKYHLNTTHDDVKRYLMKSHYKLVQSFTIESTQSITEFSAINAFYSYLTFAACSDRSLHIYDMNVSKPALILRDIHTRPCHCIALNKGCMSKSTRAYDLCATAAVADCIKLWDLRSARCVRRYESHHNRAFQCRVDFSPCCRFLVTGSEDKAAYVYDLRGGPILTKLSSHADVCTVAYHPFKSQLITGTIDGKLGIFSP